MAYLNFNAIFEILGLFTIRCIYYFPKKLLIILRWSTKHANFWSGVQYPLKTRYLSFFYIFKIFFLFLLLLFVCGGCGEVCVFFFGVCFVLFCFCCCFVLLLFLFVVSFVYVCLFLFCFCFCLFFVSLFVCLFCFVLFCFDLFCFVLFCFVLFYFCSCRLKDLNIFRDT